MKHPLLTRGSALALGSTVMALVVAACSDVAAPTPSASAPTALRATTSATTTLDGAPALLACANPKTGVASATIGPNGGSFHVAGTRIDIPAGAVPEPTRFRLELPESPYAEIEVTADGNEHYTFQRPVTVTISYARCGAHADSAQTLDAWYVESGTRKLLQQMPSVDDRPGRKLTFTTDHFSGYAVAERRPEWSY